MDQLDSCKTLILDRSLDDVILFIISLVQFIQLNNTWILENQTVKQIYKYKYLCKYRDENKKIDISNIENIINFIKSCNKINNSCDIDYITKRIYYIAKYLEKGFVIFSCNKNKTPKLCAWNKLSYDTCVKCLTHQEVEFTNIGILCGKSSGVVVLDIDIKDNGMIYWLQLLTKYNNSKDIDTLTTITGSNGRHYFFKYEDKMDNWYSCNRLFTKESKIGIDLRTKNGYVILPPSIHEKYKTIYEFKNNDIDHPIINMPEWLYNEINYDILHRIDKRKLKKIEIINT